MKCEICSQIVKPGDYLNHLSEFHPHEYEEFMHEIISLNNSGNWSPYIPRNLILRYSKENDTVARGCQTV